MHQQPLYKIFNFFISLFHKFIYWRGSIKYYRTGLRVHKTYFHGKKRNPINSPIPEHEISRFWLLRDKFVIVEAVLNISVQATAFSRVFFYIKVEKMKEQLVNSKVCFFNHPNVHLKVVKNRTTIFTRYMIY